MLILQKERERALDGGGIDGVDAEEQEGAGPVERFGDRRGFFEVEAANGVHDAADAAGERFVDVGDAGAEDGFLAFDIGIVHVQKEAAPFERFGELAGVVGRQDHQRGA